MSLVRISGAQGIWILVYIALVQFIQLFFQRAQLLLSVQEHTSLQIAESTIDSKALITISKRGHIGKSIWNVFDYWCQLSVKPSFEDIPTTLTTSHAHLGPWLFARRDDMLDTA